MHQFIGIDVDDMSRGQGEWKNMQEVIRRSFRAVFEHMSNQQDQIKELNEVCTLNTCHAILVVLTTVNLADHIQSPTTINDSPQHERSYTVG